MINYFRFNIREATHRRICGGLALLLLTLAGSGIAQESAKGDKPQEEVTPYFGPKQVVAVLPFDNRVKNVPLNWRLGEGLSEILITELIKSNRFLLVEREAIQDIVKEQEAGMSGLVRQETAAKTGQLSGAQFMIKGAITEFNAEAAGGGLSIAFRQGEVGGKSRTAYVGIDVRIVDNATGQIHASYNASGTAKSKGASLAAAFGGSDNVKIGASAFYSTALGQATRQAVQKIVTFILEESANIPWQGSVIQSKGSNVYVNRGKSANVKAGDTLKVYAKGEPLIDPETGFNLGSDEEYLCDITVTRLMPKFSSARKTPDCKGQDIRRGDLVRY